MAHGDRRKHRRTRLRLRIARLEGFGPALQEEDLWTSDVCAGGMLFQVPLPSEPNLETSLSFELNVPPGEGYSSSAGRIRGSGRVVRALPVSDKMTGVAVQFTQPLSLDF
ncbi:MAG TPA: PilZ domain-containing protein [Phycisphaerae bacterium]|nr:PilZ domain-containing protein [Phycisphaerae bacterium]